MLENRWGIIVSRLLAFLCWNQQCQRTLQTKHFNCKI